MDRADYELAGQSFRVTSQPMGSRSLLVLKGEIGSDAAAALRDEAQRLAANPSDVDVDWREAATVTTSCLQVLLALGVALGGSGSILRVTGDNPAVRRFLELAGLSARFPVAERLEGALPA